MVSRLRKGPVIVTGAAGGVGSVAISLLSKLGFTVIASTGRPEEEPYLRSLGASELLARQELSGPGKPLGRERWAGAVDSAGSHTLANVLAQTKYGGVGRRMRIGSRHRPAHERRALHPARCDANLASIP